MLRKLLRHWARKQGLEQIFTDEELTEWAKGQEPEKIFPASVFREVVEESYHVDEVFTDEQILDCAESLGWIPGPYDEWEE